MLRACASVTHRGQITRSRTGESRCRSPQLRLRFSSRVETGPLAVCVALEKTGSTWRRVGEQDKGTQGGTIRRGEMHGCITLLYRIKSDGRYAHSDRTHSRCSAECDKYKHGRMITRFGKRGTMAYCTYIAPSA